MVTKTAEGLVQIQTAPLGRRQRWERALSHQPLVGPTVVLLLAAVVFGLWVGSRFIDPVNLSLILQQVMIVGLLGIAQTLVILTAGIDLSVAAIMVLSQVVMGKLAVEHGVPVPLAILVGIAVGGLCGLVNGLLVTRFSIPPFIATLGTLSIFYALNLYISKSQTIPFSKVPAALQWPGSSFSMLGVDITFGSLLLVAGFLTAAYVLHETAWGTRVYAVGDNAEAARLSGVRVNRVLLSVYIAAGLICGLAGWFLIGRLGSVSPLAAANLNLDSITAVVIGGTSLFGGRGRIMGTLLGALIVGVFGNGLALAGVDVLWQVFTIGLLIVVAVGLDQRLRRAAR
ncbi:MAG: ABC transporter permease [Kineosporiaceae bacterium]